MDNLVDTTPCQRKSSEHKLAVIGLVLVTLVLVVLQGRTTLLRGHQDVAKLPIHFQETLEKCNGLHTLPGPPPDFHSRNQSDRYVEGASAVLIRNATIWTGHLDGRNIVKGDILLDRGIIKAVGRVDLGINSQFGHLKVYDAHGSWVTPGLVDLHSHLGIYSAPVLDGAFDVNSYHGPILPWLRSLDGLNTRDPAYALSIAGGLTSALVLPGSANAIGGQAFPIKLRPTKERTPTSMLLEPPHTINGSLVPSGIPPRWRHMKHACGENPRLWYDNARMDNIWSMRTAYEKARQVKQKQDIYCSAALQGKWEGLGEFPEDLQWEGMVDTLRSKVKVHNHCYETVDLNSMILMSQEFKFPIAAFHHAHETYLITDQLKTAYGGAPAVAIFALTGGYKREAYRGSEFAPKILHEAGIRVVLKSDHPVINSRHLIFEAQQAYQYGLPEEAALSAVISTPASVAGLDHRIGYIKKGYDADLVVWDSHPLTLGTTPKQVFIDGVAQLEDPFIVSKPAAFHKAPETPNWDKESKEALKYNGLPPLKPRKCIDKIVAFTNVSSLFLKDETLEIQEQSFVKDSDTGMIIVEEGVIICSGFSSSCLALLAAHPDAEIVDLDGGSIGPGFTTFGSALGIEEIQAEPSTGDGRVLDPFVQVVPEMIGGTYGLVRAVDGLLYSTRHALLAYLRGGVTAGIVAPQSSQFLSGLSASFSTSATHKLARGAIVDPEAALHVTISLGLGFATSVSTQIAALRRLLLTTQPRGELDAAFRDVAHGKHTLAIHTQSADVISSVLMLKQEVEKTTGQQTKFTIVGAREAHLLAKELGNARVGVILVPFRPYPTNWESRRILPGPPVTEKSEVFTLLKAGVTVGIGEVDPSIARNARLNVAWAAIETGGKIGKKQAYALASSNIEKLLGAKPSRDLVVTHGGDLLDFNTKIVGVISPERGVVDLI